MYLPSIFPLLWTTVLKGSWSGFFINAPLKAKYMCNNENPTRPLVQINI